MVQNVVYCCSEDALLPKSGPHPINKLSAVFVKSCTKPGRYADGHGLYLQVGPGAAKRWLLRIVVQGLRKDIALGSARLISLKDARASALTLRATARAGKPLPDKKTSTASTPNIPTFQHAAIQVHEDRVETYKNKKHAAQWIQSLKTYTFPYFGNTPVNQIQTTHVIKALRPIWISKPETARRVKQRIQFIFDWAKAHGHYQGDNPASNVTSILPRQQKNTKHFEAMPYDQVPAFIQSLSKADVSEQSRLGIILIILTALRTNEVRLGSWFEVNWQHKVWTIPETRQLKKVQPTPHTVPLTPQCIHILKCLKALNPKASLIFPGTAPQKPISDMTFLMALRRLNVPYTIHGFRSSFRDWASEETNHRDVVVEKSLAHEISNKVEAAYRRGDLLKKRRILMTDWAEHVLPPKNLHLF